MMTEQERKEARREASRKCYLKRKAAAAKHAEKPTRGKKTAKKAPAKKAAKIRPAADPLKPLEKLVKKFARPAAEMKTLIKEATELAKSVYQAKDAKIAEKFRHSLEKNFGILVSGDIIDNPNGKPKRSLFFNLAGKNFSVPVAPAEKRPPAEAPVRDAAADEDDLPEETPTEPEALKNMIENGETPPAGENEEECAVVDEPAEDEDWKLADDEDEEKDEEECDDEDELTDDERERRRWKEEQALDADYAAGRAEAMRELGAQGWGEEN